MIADVASSPERRMQQTLLPFENHLLVNRNAEKPVLHISLTPPLDDCLLETQYAALAFGYMDKTGCGDQPCIVYLPEDAERRPLHVVPICVGDAGRKINDRCRVAEKIILCGGFLENTE